LTETWYEDASSISIDRLRILGYNAIEEARAIPSNVSRDTVSFTNHGGVTLATKLPTKVHKLIDKGAYKTFEYVSGLIVSGSSKGVVVVVYRPGSSPHKSDFFWSLKI